MRHTNARGTVSFAATGAPNSRTTQVFVNLASNAFLDPQRFAPFAQVTSGMKVLGKLYRGYGEQPSSAQGQMSTQGDAFVRTAFPKLDRILTAGVVR